jgi:hypothetical protein
LWRRTTVETSPHFSHSPLLYCETKSVIEKSHF